MSSDTHLDRTVGSLPTSNPQIEFTVGNVADYDDDDTILHMTFSGVLDNIFQDGLQPGKPSASEALATAKLGNKADLDSHPAIGPMRKADQYLERLRSEAPGGTNMLPPRTDSLKYWFDHRIVEKMLDGLNLPDQSNSIHYDGDPITGAPYVTLFINPTELDGQKMLLTDYDRVYEVTQYVSQYEENNDEETKKKLVHAAHQYWSEGMVTNGIESARRMKEPYHIPELLAPDPLPPQAIEKVLVPSESS